MSGREGAPPLQLPGYTWDPESRRFFKQSTSANRTTPAASARAATAHALAQAERDKQANEETRVRQTRAKQARERRFKRDDDDDDNGGGGHDRNLAAYLAPWLGQPARRDAYKHRLQGQHLGAKIESIRTVYPDCLPVDDSVQCISFDETNPSALRVGTANGLIATGYLTQAPAEMDMYPNDEERWRTGWFCSSKITSLKTCRDRIVATCLGQPAQAIVGTTHDNFSLASITLSPRKTSLWTSAISRDVVALGGDRSVLLSPLASLSNRSSPGRPSNGTASTAAAGGGMDAYVTGGRGGGGTVFALEIDEPGRIVWAGVRKGDVIGFDWRSRRGAAGGEGDEGGGEVNIPLGTPITHLRLVPGQMHELLVAAMGGQLAIYDLRFLRPPSPSSASIDSSVSVPPPPPRKRSQPGQKYRHYNPTPGTAAGAGSRSGVHAPSPPVPVVKMEGHVNTFSTELGLDVWKDEWVAIAGQDSRLRIFSLRTGLPLAAPPSTASTLSPPATTSGFSILWEHNLSSSSSTTTTPSADSQPSSSRHPLARAFSGPIKSLAFSPLDPFRLRDKSYTTRAALESADQLSPRWDCPSLWLAEGAGIECFAVQ